MLMAVTICDEQMKIPRRKQRGMGPGLPIKDSSD
jgi:hypothetical protein